MIVAGGVESGVGLEKVLKSPNTLVLREQEAVQGFPESKQGSALLICGWQSATQLSGLHDKNDLHF